MRAGLAVLVAAALAGGCSKRPPPEPASTTIDEAEFRVTLPGGWTEKKTGGEVTLAAPQRRENVTVGTLAIPGEDPRSVVDRLVELRRSAILRAGAGVVVSRPTYEETGGTLRVRFQATDDAAGTFTSCLFLATRTRVLTVVFSEYGKPSATDAAARADAIFATFTAK